MPSIKIASMLMFCVIIINCFIFGNQETNVKNCSEFSFILGPSSLGGIGVFAAHDIPAGTLLPHKGHTIRIMKIKDVPTVFLKYCLYINNEECICPEQFDRMEIGWFFNHSAKPNITYNIAVINNLDLADGSTIPAFTFYALSDIKAGDEILINYNELNEPEQMQEGYQKS